MNESRPQGTIRTRLNNSVDSIVAQYHEQVENVVTVTDAIGRAVLVLEDPNALIPGNHPIVDAARRNTVGHCILYHNKSLNR